MVSALDKEVGDVGGTQPPLTLEQAQDSRSKHMLKSFYRPDERVRPVVFNVLDSSVAFLGITWNALGHLVETPDNKTHWRWKHEKAKPSYKYVLKLLSVVIGEGFRRDREMAKTLVPLRKLVIREMNNLEPGYELLIPETPVYPFELQGNWRKKEGDSWDGTTKHIMRLSKDLVSSDELLKYVGETLLEDVS